MIRHAKTPVWHHCYKERYGVYIVSIWIARITAAQCCSMVKYFESNGITLMDFTILLGCPGKVITDCYIHQGSMELSTTNREHTAKMVMTIMIMMIMMTKILELIHIWHRNTRFGLRPCIVQQYCEWIISYICISKQGLTYYFFQG